MKISKSTIFEISPVDFAHFSLFSSFKWLENRRTHLIWIKRDCLKALKLSVNIFKADCNKTVLTYKTGH